MDWVDAAVAPGAAEHRIRHQQLKNHSLGGTIVITASAAHRSSAMLQPLNLDVDKVSSIDNCITQVCDLKPVGIPISFFFKKISKAHIARLWRDKHFAMAKTKGDPAAAKNPPVK